MVQQNIFMTFIHHKLIMQTHRFENLFFASYSFKDLLRWTFHRREILRTKMEIIVKMKSYAISRKYFFKAPSLTSMYVVYNEAERVEN